MGQKVHPLGFRLSISQDHQTLWYANTNDYSIYVLEDNFIRQGLLQKFSDANIVKIRIERRYDLIRIFIVAAQPRAFSVLSFTKHANLSQKTIAKRKKAPLNALRDDLTQAVIAYRKEVSAFEKERTLKNTLFFGDPEIEIYVDKLTRPFTSAVFIADAISLDIEKRISFRRAMKFAIQRAQRAGVPGIKVQISGRLNGAEIARSETLRKGRIPLHTVQAKIDYSCQTAQTIYGIIGIKVWVFQGMAH